MNLIEEIYQKIVSVTTERRQNQFFSMLMESHSLTNGLRDVQTTEKEIRPVMAILADTLCSPYQLVTKTEFYPVSLAYEKALAMLLPVGYDETSMHQSADTLADTQLLEQIRAEAKNAYRHLPVGSGYYPVTAHPDQWKSTLKSGFSKMDMLKSFHYYLQEYYKAAVRRESLVRSIILYTPYENTDSNPTLGKIKELREQLYKTLPQFCIHFMGVFRAKTKVTDSINQELTQLISTKYPKNKLENTESALSILLQQHETSLNWNNLLTELISVIPDSWPTHLLEMKCELYDVLSRLKVLKRKLRLSVTKAQENQVNDTLQLLPHHCDDSYDSVTVKSDFEKLQEPISLKCQHKNIAIGLNGLFPGAVPIGITEALLTNHLKIEVGFLVQRISLEREWFYPQIFRQPQFKSIGNPITYPGPSLKHAGKSTALFPVYPESLVLAKDITIRFTFDDVSAGCIPHFYHHICKRRGFLCFGEIYQDNIAFCDLAKRQLICKYAWPHMLGYYMTFV